MATQVARPWRALAIAAVTAACAFQARAQFGLGLTPMRIEWTPRAAFRVADAYQPIQGSGAHHGRDAGFHHRRQRDAPV